MWTKQIIWIRHFIYFLTWHVSRAGAMTSRPKWMSLFITSFIRHQAMSVIITPYQTRLYSQLVDFSGAINSADPWCPLLGGPRWLRRKPTDVGRRTVKSSPVEVKESWRVSQLSVSQGVELMFCLFGGLCKSLRRWWHTSSSTPGSGNTCIF